MIATITLEGEDFEVGADVELGYYGDAYEVSEPDVSAPGCTLKRSRLVDDSTLPKGWSDLAEEALVDAYREEREDAVAARADWLYDSMREDDHG